MNLGFRALAALFSVAVSLNTGCEVRRSSAAGTSPLLDVDIQKNDIAEPVVPSAEEYVPAEDADCTVTFSSDGAFSDGSGVTAKAGNITINKDGVYLLTGECGDGSVSIQADDVSLILDGLTLSSKGEHIISQDTGKLTLTIPNGSSNTLHSSGSAISGMGQVTVNGGGALELSGEKGIVCGGLKLLGGDVRITAASDGIQATEHVLVGGGSALVRARGDGIRVTGREEIGFSIIGGGLDIVSDYDGIRVNSGAYISDGELLLCSGGGSSAVMHVATGAKYSYGRHGGFYTDGSDWFDFSDLVSGDGSGAGSKKGLRCTGDVFLCGGSVAISSADDSICSGGRVVLADGAVRLLSGDDAIHCDGSVKLSGGSLDVADSYCAIEGKTVEVAGGKISLRSFHDGIVISGGNSSGYSMNTESAERYISISGGELVIDSGGDGIDSAGNAAVSGGTVTVFSSDDDRFGSLYYKDSFAMGGGVLAAFGSDGITRAPSLLSVPCISLYAAVKKGALFEVRDMSGAVLFAVTMPKECSSVIFSSPNIAEGGDYSVSADGIVIAEITASGGVCGGGPGDGDKGMFDILTGNNAVAV